jgi:hypothetical protein
MEISRQWFSAQLVREREEGNSLLIMVNGTAISSREVEGLNMIAAEEK